MAHFDLQKIRDIANEGIARHGLRGYARKLGLDVSTVRSLRDGRDMQISKVTEIVAALNLSLELWQITSAAAPAEKAAPGPGAAAQRDVSAHITLPFHCSQPQDRAAPVALNPAWLAAQGWNVQCLRWITAPPKTDAACVQPGALCLIDCEQTWPEAHAIWAYLDAGTLNIAYLHRPLAGTLLIAGSDPAQGARHLSGPALDAITPLGRVVWVQTLPPVLP
ncbi:hypothetical protein [Roseovarius dicentrarchi]|uniref:hypothetical protein n=1 Tax=Roseovarius dicentrarchi TaxID=2250573 RepID=UPI000DEC016F|nr:hypothetical protein [Roseovarius dicentrarchi]